MLVKGSQSRGNEESLGEESEERNAKEGNKTEHRVLGNVLIDQGEVRAMRMSQWIQKCSSQTNRRKIKAV